MIDGCSGCCNGSLLDPSEILAAIPLKPPIVPPSSGPLVSSVPPLTQPLSVATPIDLDGLDPVSLGLSAAASLEFQGPPSVTEHHAFTAIMEEIVVSPILTISHVPHSVRPLLAETLATELYAWLVQAMYGVQFMFSCFPRQYFVLPQPML